MRLALIVEYEGTDYHGFQYQVNAPSIQKELETAIERLTGEEVRVKGAGRTDAGVHAMGQVVAFDTGSALGPERFMSGLNFYLPEDIAVRAAYVVGEDFHPRRDALSRRYCYTILNSAAPSPLLRRTAYMVRGSLNVRRMQRAVNLLVGKHDFGSFTGPSGDGRGSTMGQIFDASVRKERAIVTFDVKARAFLPHQVRRLVGSLVDIGLGSLTLEKFKLMIDRRSDQAAVSCLPPQGLCLMEVTYGDFPPKVGDADGHKH